MLRADEARSKVEAYNKSIIRDYSEEVKSIEKNIIYRAEKGNKFLKIILYDFNIDLRHRDIIADYFAGYGFGVSINWGYNKETPHHLVISW